MSATATQRERLEFLEKQIAGNPWLFSGPEERAVIRELHAVLQELHSEFSKFVARFQEGEG